MGLRDLAVRLDGIGNRRFARLLQAELRADRPFGLWGYDGSALETFAMARELNRPCVLDRTIGDFRAHNAMMREVAQDYGPWFLPGEMLIPDSVIERSDAEYELADLVLAGGEFAARTIGDHARDVSVKNRVRVLNYCWNQALFGQVPPPRPLVAGEKIRFLFVGQLIPRKGVQHVLEAFDRLPPSAASLTMVGQLGIPADTFARYAGKVTHFPTVPRSEIPRLMAAHHCLVLPSWFEGSAVSLLEGLASGMALIQTPNAGAGGTAQTGVVIDRPGTGQVLDAMMAMIDDRAGLDQWRSAAQARALDFSFARYVQGVAGVMAEVKANLAEGAAGTRPTPA
jgi:glycosyltransferase involved in cell wall biosynthesis